MIKPAFTFEWEFGPDKPCRVLRRWRKFRRPVFGFLSGAQGRVVRSFLWWKGKLV